MKTIKRFNIFDLKNTQNSKLICLQLTKNEEDSTSIVLLTYHNNDFSHICSYKRPNLLFQFHSQNQKAYIINMNEG